MSFIDALFSSVLYMTIITMVWMFLCIGLAYLKPFRNKNLNIAYKITMYIISPLPMVIPMFTYWGLADNFDKLFTGKTTISLWERYEQGGGESMPETVNRLSILDMSTGERKKRMYIGYAGRLLGQRGDTVVYMHNDDLRLVNAATLEEIYHIDKDEWPKQFPALSDGVDDVSNNQNASEPQKLYITIRGKNGNNYWFDPYAKTMTETEPKDQRITGIYSTGYDLNFMPQGDKYQQSILGQVYTSNSARKKISVGDQCKRLFGPETDETFIEPKFICVDTVKKFFVFYHYRTIDRKQLWVEAKDFNFKTLWKKDSGQLEATDSYSDEEEAVSAYRYLNGMLYFNLGGYVMCMEPQTAKVRWKVRL